jgi:hypothetical protein
MPISPERDLPIEHRPEEISEIPEHIEKAGVKKRQTQFKAQVKHKGKPLIQTPQTKTITITLPTDQNTLASWSKGKVVNSLTWLGLFWLRMIKKAIHFGWKVVRKSQ